MSDVQFVDGLIVKAPHPNAPDFVKASISIKRAELIAWLQAREGEWVNLDVKESRNGKWYAAVNTYQRRTQEQSGGGNPAQEPAGDFQDDKIPFISNGGIW